MLVCDEHKFVFLKNPKTASRSITKALEDNFDVREVLGNHDWKIPKEFAGYFTFVVVRNPYSRCVSAWQHWRKSKGLSFEEFLNFCGNISDKIIEQAIAGARWKFQARILNRVKKELFFLRYETLEEEFNNLPFISKKIILPRIGVQKYGDWKSHYNPELEEKVYKALQEDFEKFKYERFLLKEKS